MLFSVLVQFRSGRKAPTSFGSKLHSAYPKVGAPFRHGAKGAAYLHCSSRLPSWDCRHLATPSAPGSLSASHLIVCVLLGRSQAPTELDAPSKPLLTSTPMVHINLGAPSSCGAQVFCARRVAVQHAGDLLQLLVSWPTSASAPIKPSSDLMVCPRVRA